MNKELVTIASLVDGSIYKPFFVFRPEALDRAASFFTQNFKGKSLYAVKTNPHPEVLQHLYRQGIKAFDVASLEEIALVYDLFPDAEMYFMHPVKSRHAIREAYFTYGIRNFSLDSEAELNKILKETDYAKDLSLHVRLAIPNTYSELALIEKFGINLQEAPQLLKLADSHAKKIGVSFHVGSQCMHPDAYRIAIRMANEVIQQAGVDLDTFNVGGGFPSVYPGMIPPNMQLFFDAIHDEFAKLPGHETMELLAEPGRALVAESMSLIVRVELRKNNTLYINDGTYGRLFDAGVPNFIFPMKLLCDEKIYSTDLRAFSFYGPTCDSLDHMEGPFYLPSDTDEGDYIEIGQLGAYSQSMASGFNGFRAEEGLYYVIDSPLMTMYGNNKNHMIDEKLEIIAA